VDFFVVVVVVLFGTIRLRLEVAPSNQDGAATEGLVKTTPSAMWRAEPSWEKEEGE
jgi:hypothetical protein